MRSGVAPSIRAAVVRGASRSTTYSAVWVTGSAYCVFSTRPNRAMSVARLPVLKKHVLCSKNGGQCRRIIRAGSESVFVYVTTRRVVGGSPSTILPRTTPGSPQLSRSSCRITTCGARARSGCAQRTSDAVDICANWASSISATVSPTRIASGRSLKSRRNRPSRSVRSSGVARYADGRPRRDRASARSRGAPGRGPLRCRTDAPSRRRRSSRPPHRRRGSHRPSRTSRTGRSARLSCETGSSRCRTGRPGSARSAYAPAPRSPPRWARTRTLEVQ